MTGRSVQDAHQARHVTEASHPSETPFGLQSSGTDPALNHLPATPSPDVAGVALDRAVEVLGEIFLLPTPCASYQCTPGRADPPRRVGVQQRCPQPRRVRSGIGSRRWRPPGSGRCVESVPTPRSATVRAPVSAVYERFRDDWTCSLKPAFNRLRDIPRAFGGRSRDALPGASAFATIVVIFTVNMTTMYTRLLPEPSRSVLLLGPRGTGKSTWLRA